MRLSSACTLAAIFTLATGAPTACAVEVTATNFVQKNIYHSPETPGYTSWCTLWRAKDGHLRVAFQQVTGPVAKPQQRTNVTVIIDSADNGVTWNKLWEIPARKHLLVSTNVIYTAPRDSSFCGHGLAALPDGTLVTGLWGRIGEEFGHLQRSSDDGQTWSKPIYFADKRHYKTWPSVIRRLRDGRLILFAAVMAQEPGKPPTTRMLKAMFESKDDGETWGKPIWLMPENVGVCEESDFAELDNGDLLFVHRVERYEGLQYADGEKCVSERWQGLVRRRGKKWEVEAPTKAPFPPSGFPELLKTREGVVLYVACEGVWWTADAGAHWQRLALHGERSYVNAVPSAAFHPRYPGIILGSPYYPRATQLADGTILVIGHNGADNVYGTVDQAIVQ